ncbi:NADH-quinone oxidoreductase subunit M [compost metagenome]
MFAIVYGALLSFAQTDIKRLVAYSSVSHMGFVLIAIYSGSQIALQGAVVQMIAHGLSAAALFILCGQLYERLHTRDMREMGGIWARMPYLPGVSLFFAAAALGLPGTGNFVGEFLILVGAFQQVPWIAVLASTGLVFGSVYSLIMIHRAYFGPSKNENTYEGLRYRELIMVLGLAGLLVLLGIYPQPVLDTSAATMHGVHQWLDSAVNQLVAR